MSRARTLKPDELRRLLEYVARRRHALRNTTQLLMTYWAGLRVGEVAALRCHDVANEAFRIREELVLPQGGGRPPRVVFLPLRLRRQLAAYLNAHPPADPAQPLFYTQKRAGWTANTLAQHFFHLYRAAGLAGASSQSGRNTHAAEVARRHASGAEAGLPAFRA